LGSSQWPYIIGVGVGILTGLYVFRKPVATLVVHAGDQAVNMFVELKWMFKASPTLAPAPSEKQRCESRGSQIDGHNRYVYKGMEYIIRDAPIPFQDDIDKVYDPDERITNIKLHKTQNGQSEWTQADDTIQVTIKAHAGPLCDFHNSLPTIKNILPDLVGEVDSIVVDTENYQHYVIS
jgi:hypothetical protein